MGRVPKNVVAVTPGGSITIDQILGHLCMFSVPDQPVSLAKVLREFGANDLDTTLLPDKRVPVNVFQQACKSIETGRRTEHGREIVSDKIYEDAHKCVYQITIKIRDKDTERITFESSMRVRFSKTTSLIEFEELEHAAYKALKPLEQEIQDHFDQHAKMIPGAKVRGALRGYMRTLGGTNVLKRSGAYFVPKGMGKKPNKPKETLDTIESVLTRLYGEAATMWMVPLADSGSERDMVGTHFAINMEEQVTEEVQKIAEVLQRDPKYVRKDVLKNRIEERRRLGELHARYSDLLDSSLSNVAERLAIYDEQLEALAEKADELGTEAP